MDNHSDIQVFRDSVKRFLTDNWSLEQATSLVSSAPARKVVWEGLVEQGAVLLGSAEAGGLTVALPLLRELGAAHCPAPLPAAVVLNAVLADAGVPDWLLAIQEGAVVPAFAVTETVSGVPSVGQVQWQSGRLSGQLQMVDAMGANHLVVLLTTASGGAALACVPLSAPGLTLTGQVAYLEPGLSQVQLNGAEAKVHELSVQAGRDMALLWRLALVARATGALERAQEVIVDYVKNRRQFGVPIGSFQAIQHKLADIQIALDGALLTQGIASQAFDAGNERWRVEASVAIAAADPVLRKAMLEVHHAFGAIGYSEEHEATRHFRRVHLDLAQASGGVARRELVQSRAAEAEPVLAEPDLGPQAEFFRREVRDWIDSYWTPARRQAELDRPVSERGASRECSQAMGGKGWIAATWPKAWGGQERTRREQLALIQETTRAMLPMQAHIAASNLIAPALLAFGSDEQKAFFLPRIARGDLTISLGYSEPESGSDLASLRTRAVQDGDEWVITGQKMWGTLTDKADYVWLAARTDPEAKKHAGISVFLIPLNLPGISIRPSMAMYGKTFSTQFFDEVRVPASALVGGVNRGWHVITGALADERILMGAGVTQVANGVVQLVKALRKADRLDALALDRVGALVAEVGVARALLMRSVLLTEQGQDAYAEAAITKTYSGELMERFGETAIDLVGPLAALSQGTPGAVGDGELDRLLRFAPMQVIGGGANEIQRTLIAQRGLGLPR